MLLHYSLGAVLFFQVLAAGSAIGGLLNETTGYGRFENFLLLVTNCYFCCVLWQAIHAI